MDGRLGEAREHRGLGDGHVPQRLAEVDLRRGGEAVGALAEEDLVDVELEDLVLGQVGLDLPGEQDLAQLAGDRLLAGQEEVAGDLHGDGAGPLLGAGREVGERGARDAQIVDTAVLVETFVFCGQNGLFHDIRDFADGDDGAPFLSEFAEKVAFGGNDAQGNFGLVVGKCLEGRKSRPQQGQYKRAQQGADHGEAQENR